MKITVFGAGAWGTALASHAAAAHDVVLWGRDAAQLAAQDRGMAQPPEKKKSSRWRWPWSKSDDAKSDGQ